MKICQRNNGGWCMEHNGTEAPYDVVCHVEDKFSVFDVDDEEGTRPIANLEDKETCERLALAHYESTAQATKPKPAMTSDDDPIGKIPDLEKRIARLEQLLHCPRCHGQGYVTTSLGNDECPSCHGEQFNAALNHY